MASKTQPLGITHRAPEGESKGTNYQSISKLEDSGQEGRGLSSTTFCLFSLDYICQ